MRIIVGFGFLVITFWLYLPAYANIGSSFNHEKMIEFLKIHNLNEVLEEKIDERTDKNKFFPEPPVRATLQDIYNNFFEYDNASLPGLPQSHIYNLNSVNLPTLMSDNSSFNGNYESYYSTDVLLSNEVEILTQIEFENLEVETNDTSLQEFCPGCDSLGGILQDFKSLLRIKKSDLYTADDFCKNSGYDTANAFRWQEIAKPRGLKKFLGRDHITGKPKYKYYLSETTAYYILLRMQKPGSYGYLEEDDFKLLKAIFAYKKFHKKYHDLYLGALQSLVGGKNESFNNGMRVQFFRHFLFSNPAFLARTQNYKHVCRTKTDIYNIQRNAEDYIYDYLDKDSIKEYWELYQFLPVLPLVDLNANQEFYEQRFDQIAQNWADTISGSNNELIENNKAPKNTLLSDIPNNKIWFYANQAIKHFFGFKSRQDSELVKLHNPNRMTFFIISSDPIDKSDLTQTRYGFHYKHLKTVFFQKIISNKEEESELLRLSTQWHSHNIYTEAEVIGKTMPNSYENDDTQPPYNEFIKDGILTGIIFTSTSRQSDKWITSEYLDFYKDAGYEFEALKTIKDFDKFLEEKIESGEVDYIRQDAHSANGLGSIPTDVELYVGIKVFQPGEFFYKEKENYQGVIYLARPINKNYSHIDAGKFARWIKNRDHKNATHLLYMDGKCRTTDNAVNLLAHAQSNNLTILPTYKGVHPMKYYQKDPNRKMLYGLLNGQSYAQMREEMAKGNGEYNNMFSDVWLFPDMDKYKERIVQLLEVPVAFDIEYNYSQNRIEVKPQLEFSFNQSNINYSDIDFLIYTVTETYDNSEILTEIGRDRETQQERVTNFYTKSGHLFAKIYTDGNYYSSLVIMNRNGEILYEAEAIESNSTRRISTAENIELAIRGLHGSGRYFFSISQTNGEISISHEISIGQERHHIARIDNNGNLLDSNHNHEQTNDIDRLTTQGHVIVENQDSHGTADRQSGNSLLHRVFNYFR